MENIDNMIYIYVIIKKNEKMNIKLKNLLQDLQAPSSNINYGTRSTRTSKAVGQYTRDGNLIKVWQSTIEVERQLGFAHGNISNVARGKQKTAYGYVWKYVKEGK
jgi:hypothetical protein